MRKNVMELTPEREIEINTGGSIETLAARVEKENINIDVITLMRTIPEYVKPKYMTARQMNVFKSYYLQKMSIYQIRFNSIFEFRSFTEVERTLNAATERYIKNLRKDYGVK